MKRHVWRVNYFFIKRLTNIETSSTFLNSHQKTLQKILFHDLSIDQVLFLISWTTIETSRNTRIIFLSFSIDRAKVSTYRKYWFSNFHLINFRTWNFHFMKPYSPNLNVIITTYPCIYLYIQHDDPSFVRLVW